MVTTVESVSDLLPAFTDAQNTDPLGTDMKKKIGYPDLWKTGGEDGYKDKDTDMLLKVSASAVIFEGRIYVPEALCNQVISLFHSTPESGNFGALRTAELISKDIYWLGLDTTMWEYVTGC